LNNSGVAKFRKIIFVRLFFSKRDIFINILVYRARQKGSASVGEILIVLVVRRQSTPQRKLFLSTNSAGGGGCGIKAIFRLSPCFS
jgi:hypothetical protein